LSASIFAELPSELSLTIPAFIKAVYTGEEIEAIQAGLNEISSVAFDMQLKYEDGEVRGWQWPDTSRREVRTLLMKMGYRLEGPWVFIVDIPATSPEISPEVTAEPVP
jgi:hypothetical protein